MTTSEINKLITTLRQRATQRAKYERDLRACERRVIELKANIEKLDKESESIKAFADSLGITQNSTKKSTATIPPKPNENKPHIPTDSNAKPQL